MLATNSKFFFLLNIFQRRKDLALLIIDFFTFKQMLNNCIFTSIFFDSHPYLEHPRLQYLIKRAAKIQV